MLASRNGDTQLIYFVTVQVFPILKSSLPSSFPECGCLLEVSISQEFIVVADFAAEGSKISNNNNRRDAEGGQKS
jgi:hypothetical protein